MQKEIKSGSGVDTMLTVSEIATIMGFSTHTVREMVKSGVFPRVVRANLGNGSRGHIRIYKSDFERWREESTDHAFEE